MVVADNDEYEPLERNDEWTLVSTKRRSKCDWANR
jgi:hypothetical protein